MGEVDVGAEVVAVAVDGAAVVDADPRLRALLEQGQEADRPLGQGHRVGRDDHHLVADRLHDQRLGRQRRLDRLDEALDQVERLLVALLLGVAGEAGQVDEAERHLHPAHLPHAAEVGLHVADDVLLDVEAQVALVDVLHQRRGQRQQVAGQALHLLRHLERVDPLADQRLVDVEVEQPHLGLGDLADRLRVDADQLQQRRRAGSRRRARRPCCSIASTSCSLSVPSSAVGVPSSVITRSISSSSRPVRAAASARSIGRSRRPGSRSST